MCAADEGLASGRALGQRCRSAPRAALRARVQILKLREVLKCVIRFVVARQKVALEIELHQYIFQTPKVQFTGKHISLEIELN